MIYEYCDSHKRIFYFKITSNKTIVIDNQPCYEGRWLHIYGVYQYSKKLLTLDKKWRKLSDEEEAKILLEQ